MPNTIGLKGEFIRKEVIATGVVTPGMQVSILGAAGGGRRKAFALENDLIGRDIDDNYAVGETMQIGLMPTGAEVWAWLSPGENVARGARLQGAGDGTLEAAGSTDPDLIAYADEAVNNTTSDPVRIRVEIA